MRISPQLNIVAIYFKGQFCLLGHISIASASGLHPEALAIGYFICQFYIDRILLLKYMHPQYTFSREAGNRTRATRSQSAYTTIMLHPEEMSVLAC